MPAILSDAAAACDNDLLAFNRYVAPLARLFADPDTGTPFTVGIFGTWGSGKSTLLKMLDQRLALDYPGRFIAVHFNPWLHRGDDNMLLPLLHTLQDTLCEPKWERFKESATRIGNVLLKLAGDVLLKTVTADAVSLEHIEKLEQDYLKERGRVSSEIRKLHSTLQGEADRINERGKARLIFFIDDLDRCEPDEIIDVLEAVKLFLDLEHAFIVLAVDKEVIDRGIQIKYSKFEFAETRKLSLGAEYLEKMVQLPLHLYPPSPDQVRRFIDGLGPIANVRDQLDLLHRLVLPNPRKIKRILNMLTITDEIMRSTPGLPALDRGLLTRLTVLRVQDAELFARSAAQPHVLRALDGIYAEQPLYRLEVEADWAPFGLHRKGIRELATTYFRPDTYLLPLFRGSGLGAMPVDQIQPYISMIGA